MASVPELSDETINGLLARAAADPAATRYGLRPPHGDWPFYWFSKPDADHFHNEGDGVTCDWFRIGVQDVIASRGNLLGERQDVVDAYWDMIRSEPDDWCPATILTVASVCVLLGVMEDQADWQ